MSELAGFWGTVVAIRTDENECSQKDPPASDLHIGGCLGGLRLPGAKGAVP